LELQFPTSENVESEIAKPVMKLDEWELREMHAWNLQEKVAVHQLVVNESEAKIQLWI
jgi:hypothetical protein